MVVDDDDYDDDVWDDATEGWKGLKGWGSNGKWCIIHKIDYILTIVTEWLSDWLTDEAESWDAIASKKYLKVNFYWGAQLFLLEILHIHAVHN